jgi:hypothetical protein
MPSKKLGGTARKGKILLIGRSTGMMQGIAI